MSSDVPPDAQPAPDVPRQSQELRAAVEALVRSMDDLEERLVRPIEQHIRDAVALFRQAHALCADLEELRLRHAQLAWRMESLRSATPASPERIGRVICT